MIKELMISNPKVSIIILAFLMTFFMTLVTKFVSDQKKIKELKTTQKDCRINLKKFQLGSPEYMKVQQEMMACSMEIMKKSFKPMLYSFIPLIIFFWWIRGIYSEVFSSWLWWYIGAGVFSSIVLRKLLKVA